MDLQWTSSGMRSCRGLPVDRSVGLRLYLSPGAGLFSGFAPLATVPSQINPRGYGVAFFRLPSRCGGSHTTIFRLLRRWVVRYLPKLGLFTHSWDSG